MCFISSLAPVKLISDVFDEPFEARIFKQLVMVVPAVEVMECMVWTVVVRILDENHHMGGLDVSVLRMKWK